MDKAEGIEESTALQVSNGEICGRIEQFGVKPDFHLITKNKIFQAHKAIFGTCSNYLLELFMKVPYGPVIYILEDVCSFDVENLLMFVYEGKISVTSDNSKGLLHAASQLKIDSLAKELEKTEKLLNKPISKCEDKPMLVAKGGVFKKPRIATPMPPLPKPFSYPAFVEASTVEQGEDLNEVIGSPLLSSTKLNETFKLNAKDVMPPPPPPSQPLQHQSPPSTLEDKSNINGKEREHLGSVNNHVADCDSSGDSDYMGELRRKLPIGKRRRIPASNRPSLHSSTFSNAESIQMRIQRKRKPKQRVEKE